MTQWRKRGKRREKGEVEGRPALLGGVEKLGEGLPVPGDAAIEHLERNTLDIDEIAHRDFACLGLAGRDADAAIAHHHRSDAVPRGRADRRVPADLRVVMRVRVDKTGRDDAIGRIDDLRRAVADPADFGDFSVFNGDIGLAARRSGAIDHGAVLDQQVVGHRRISLCC